MNTLNSYREDRDSIIKPTIIIQHILCTGQITWILCKIFLNILILKLVFEKDNIKKVGFLYKENGYYVLFIIELIINNINIVQTILNWKNNTTMKPRDTQNRSNTVLIFFIFRNYVYFALKKNNIIPKKCSFPKDVKEHIV